MSWRSFRVLLRGLSAQSVTAARLSGKGSKGSSRIGGPDVIEEPGAVDAALARAFGG